MYDKLPGFNDWVNELHDFQPLSWDHLPDIELYMDQVISYMERQILPFKVKKEEKIVTPSMINNYIKDGVVPKTVKKKYSKEHMAVLSIVCMLKQILPIQDLHKLLEIYRSEADIQHIYHDFCEMQQEALESMCEELNHNPSAKTVDKEELCLLAMRLAIGANTARIASQKIIASLSAEDKADSDFHAEESKKS